MMDLDPRKVTTRKILSDMEALKKAIHHDVMNCVAKDLMEIGKQQEGRIALTLEAYKEGLKKEIIEELRNEKTV